MSKKTKTSKPTTRVVRKKRFFSDNNVVNLHDEDFYLDEDKEKSIMTRRKDCMSILFYVENEESVDYNRVWKDISDTYPGVLYACNLKREYGVAKAFQEIKNTDSPLSKFGIVDAPVIIAYRGGYPKAFFNGDTSVEAIGNWVLDLACNAGYEEPIRIPRGITPDNEKNTQTGKWDIPQAKEYRNSGQFTNDKIGRNKHTRGGKGERMSGISTKGSKEARSKVAGATRQNVNDKRSVSSRIANKKKEAEGTSVAQRLKNAAGQLKSAREKLKSGENPFPESELGPNEPSNSVTEESVPISEEVSEPVSEEGPSEVSEEPVSEEVPEAPVSQEESEENSIPEGIELSNNDSEENASPEVSSEEVEALPSAGESEEGVSSGIPSVSTEEQTE